MPLVLLPIASCGEHALICPSKVYRRSLSFRFDELHPSEQADRIVAREVAAAIRRKSSKWVTWFS